MSTWTLFVKIWTVSNCEFNANILTFLSLYHLLFVLETIGVISILAGNLNLGRSYLITTVKTCLCLPALKNRVAFYGYPICLMDTRMATACTFLTNGGSLLNSHGLIINKKTIIIIYKTTIQLFIFSTDYGHPMNA